VHTEDPLIGECRACSFGGAGCRGGRARAACLLGVIALAIVLLGPATSAEAETWGMISGEVTDASSRAPLQGIEVCVISTNFELFGEEESEYEHREGCATTGPGGEYTVSELRAESYFVEFFAMPASKLDYIAQLYNDKFELSEASSVPVVAEKTTPGIDAELSLGAEIAGRVTNVANGTPIGEALACALRTNAEGSPEGSCAFTEASGEYTIRGLPSGGYKVGFHALGFELQYYNEKASQAEAELVSVIAPELTPGIDAAMTPGGPAVGPGSTSEEVTPASKLPGGITGASSSPPDATLSLLGTRIAVAANASALVKVECAGTMRCRAKLTLRVNRMVTVKGRRTLRSEAIGKSSVVSIAAGRKGIVRVRLNLAGRNLLSAGHGRLEVELALATPGRKQDDSVVLVERKARDTK
jgi:hypothetical protein